MRLGARFLTQARRYIALEKRMNRDFSEAEITISASEQARLIEAGETPEEAAARIDAFWLRERGTVPTLEETPSE